LPLRPDLRRQAHEFAQRINDLLNRTVADGVRVHALIREDGRIGWVGYRTGARRPYPGSGIPLALPRRRPRAFLHVMHTLMLDDELRYLTAEQSSYGLYLAEDLSGCVFHYDYIRQPDNAYPPAHLQVEGASPDLDELFGRVGRSGRLGELHFPVGGKRFRPSLEEIVEFLVVEGLAEGRPGWEAAVEQHRAWYHRVQLRAAVRRDPEAAREALAEVGE
jgi:hypothetical protein